MIELYNGDCLEVLKTIKDNSIDLIVTDPPYRVTSRGSSGSMGGYWKNEIAKSGTIFKHNDISVKDFAPQFYRVLKETSHCYIMTNHINLIEYLNTFTECGFKFVKSLIWDKGNKICGRYYMNAFEYILFFRKGKDKPINNCGTSDILSIPIKKLKDKDGKNLHDTEKPIDLMKILIENSTNKGDLVLEPFMGIGSTVIASKLLGRDCIGIELDSTYFEIAKNRIENIVENKELW